MALSIRPQIRQGQGLVMTPQLTQAIKLLAMSNLDLAAYVEVQVERNPLLERIDEAESERPSADPDRCPAAAARTVRVGSDRTRLADRHERAVLAAKDGTARVLDHALAPRNGERPLSRSERVGAGGRAGGDRNLETSLRVERTLADHLAEQLVLAVTDPARRMIGQHLIDLVEETGYLAGDLALVGERLGVPRTEVEAVLAILQRFDPAGVCARDLTECIAIQLEERDRYDPAMRQLVANLGLLAKRDLVALRRICGVNEEDLADMIAEIRQLNPKPGLAFGSTPVQAIVPDVLVRTDPDRGFVVDLNSDTLPKVLVNRSYHAEVASNARNAEDRSYLADCLQSATWLVRALDQRANTILKVASEIVRQQEAFLLHGVRHLRPLTLRAVADAVGMHESTVSRVTNDKYMTTDRGTFELKYFFTSAIAAADGGEAHSAEAVRHRIRQLIDGERDQVLSDDSIVEKLHETGIDIARRTVAKYREAMRIPSSVQRRREKHSSLGRA
jgi:RNA polymerase sigma-54 factor